jgi:hypothetical protein
MTTLIKQKKKLSPNEILFLKYAFIGDGIYRTIERGSMKYRNTSFQSFYNKNAECVNIINRGNDAPKGGVCGDFVNVVFTSEFHIKFGWYLEQLLNERKNEVIVQNESIKRHKEQLNAINLLFKKDEEFRVKIKTRVSENSNRNWRSWVKLKVCKKLGLIEFNQFELSASEIRDVAFNY